MSAIIHSPDSRTTVSWASGASTEMFIYPSGGSFAERRFLFRISTATVEAEESTFTFFEGITRHLMILKGGLELIHEGRYTRRLKPFDHDTFSGEWSTRSKGRATDFNLMLKNGASGSLVHHAVKSGNTAMLFADAEFCFIYIAGGSFTIDKEARVSAGDLVQAGHGAGLRLAGEGDLVEIRVTLNEQAG
jgi:environmental stress-induced protein Ves